MAIFVVRMMIRGWNGVPYFHTHLAVNLGEYLVTILISALRSSELHRWLAKLSRKIGTVWQEYPAYPALNSKSTWITHTHTLLVLFGCMSFKWIRRNDTNDTFWSSWEKLKRPGPKQTHVTRQGEQLLWSANFVAGLLAAATLHPVVRSRHTKHLLQGLHGFHALQSPKASEIQR